MLHSQMMESISNRIDIKNTEVQPDVFKCMIQWIYEGECDLPDSTKDMLILLKLTDEYLLPDL